MNDAADDEGEPNPGQRPEMYTMELLLTELQQIGEADTGEVLNMSPGLEKAEFTFNFRKIINGIVKRFVKHVKDNEILGRAANNDEVRRLYKLTSEYFKEMHLSLETVAIGRLRDLIHLRHILDKLEKEDKEVIYRVINYLVSR